MILFIAFVFILSVTFGTVAYIGRPSQSEQAVDRRMREFRESGTEAPASKPAYTHLLKTEHTSRLGWLEALLQRFEVTHELQLKIFQANSKTTAAKLVLSSIGFAIAAFLLCRLLVPVLLIQIAVACALGYLPLGIVSFKRARRIAAFNAALPDAIDMIGRALRAGHSMNAALSIVAEQSVEPVAGEFAEVFKQQNFGLPLRDALTQMLDHTPSPDLRVLVTGILVQKETGGNLAEILDRTGAVIRDRMRIHGEIKTHTAQGRMTGWILCSLPIVMMIVINIVNPGYSSVLLQTPLGHKLLYTGAFLLTVGGLIIRQIINGIEV